MDWATDILAMQPRVGVGLFVCCDQESNVREDVAGSEAAVGAITPLGLLQSTFPAVRTCARSSKESPKEKGSKESVRQSVCFRLMLRAKRLQGKSPTTCLIRDAVKWATAGVSCTSWVVNDGG